MKIYSLLVTLETEPNFVYDEFGIMAKCLTIAKRYFDVVETVHHIFVQGAFTYVLVLAESHMVIQTYPELNKIFISIEYHEENEDRKMIDDAQIVKDLVADIGGTLICHDKVER